MNLFTRIKEKRQQVRFGAQPLERGILDCIVRYAWQIAVPEPAGKIDIRFMERSELAWTGGRNVQAPYYLQFFSDSSRESCLNAGYAAGQAAAYMKFRGIAASLLRAVPEWMQQKQENGLQCVAVLAFGCKDSGGRRNKNSSFQENSCIRVEKEEKWSEEILDFVRGHGLTGTEFTHMVFRNGHLHFLLKTSARKHPQQAALDAGILIANIMAASEELWIDLEIVKQKEITEPGYLLSLCRQGAPKEEASIRYA